MEAPRQDEPNVSPRERCQSSESQTSGYCSQHDDSEYSVDEQDIYKSLGCQAIKAETDRKPLLSDEILTKETVWEISKDIGRDYTALARELGFTQPEIHEIEDDNSNKGNLDKAHAVMLKFKQKEGSDATKGKLAFALDRSGRRDVAETLIGDPEFLRKRTQQKTFLLKEECHVCSNSDDINGISICKDKDGNLYRMQKLEGSGCDAYFQFKQALKAPGSTSGHMNKPRYSKEFANFKLEDLQEQVTRIENDLKENQKSTQTLKEKVKQIHELHVFVDKLICLADEVCQPQRPPNPKLKNQVFGLCNSVHADGIDLEQRVNRSLEKAVSDEEALQLNKLLEGCLSLRNKLQEKIYLGSLKDLTHKARERAHLLSASSAQRPKVKASDDSTIPRGNTMPMSGNEQRKFEEQIKPQKDPMEEDDC